MRKDLEDKRREEERRKKEDMARLNKKEGVRARCANSACS